MLEDEREDGHDREGEADLEAGGDHRPDAVEAAARIDGAERVRDGRRAERELGAEIAAGELRGIEAGQDRDADEPDEHANDLVGRDPLGSQHHGRRRNDDQRNGRGQGRRERRIDALLGPGDQAERQRDVEDRHDEQVAVRGRVARQSLARDDDDRGQEREADQQPHRHERERRQAGIHADLDEQVAAAPDPAEGEEERPVEARTGGRHGVTPGVGCGRLAVS